MSSGWLRAPGLGGLVGLGYAVTAAAVMLMLTYTNTMCNVYNIIHSCIYSYRYIKYARQVSNRLTSALVAILRLLVAFQVLMSRGRTRSGARQYTGMTGTSHD